MPESGSTASLDLVCRFLDQRQIAYQVVEHEETFTAASEAKAAGVPPEEAIKGIVLIDEQAGDEVLLAVIPASERLDIHKVCDAAGQRGLRFATENEIEQRFSDFEPGALPPFAPLLGVTEMVDSRTLEHDRVLCPGGDHRHSLLVDPRVALQIPESEVHDLCQEQGR